MSGAKNSIKKNWWAPVWKGLVMDQEAKHYQAMGCALWLYLFFILNADRERGHLIRKIKTVSSDTGLSERTIRQWLKVLRDKGYIRTQNTGRCLFIQIKKWKSILDRQDVAVQNGTFLPPRAAESCPPEGVSKGPKTTLLSQKSKIGLIPNDITIKKDILKNDIDKKKILNSDFKTFKEFNPKTKEELLAKDIAEALKDHAALPLYLSYSKKYSESFLRRILAMVKEVPIRKIKKSRGALFNYLIQQYDKKTD